MPIPRVNALTVGVQRHCYQLSGCGCGRICARPIALQVNLCRAPWLASDNIATLLRIGRIDRTLTAGTLHTHRNRGAFRIDFTMRNIYDTHYIGSEYLPVS